MRYFTTLLSSIFLILPTCVQAAQKPSDTTGMRINRTHRTVQTTVYVTRIMDSIVMKDSLEEPTVITVVTYDTLRSSENTVRTDTTYFVTKPPPKYWRLTSNSEVAFSQIIRSRYWNRGGRGNMFSILLSNQSSAIYTRKSSTWRTEFDWRYGMERQDRGPEINPWFKSHDRLALDSRYGFKASPTWNYTGLFQFNTQISRSFQSATNRTVTSRFLAPARFTFSLGMEYANTPSANAPNRVAAFFSPVAFRATYMRDTTFNSRFGVQPGQNWLATFGPMAMLENRHPLTKDITLSSKLEPFANILVMHEPFITVDWKVNLNIRITRQVSFSFETWLIYDPTMWFDKVDSNGVFVLCPEGKRIKIRSTQFQQSMRLRFTYQITN